MKNKVCELYDRECINCGECEFCDLDPTKICDNCGKCIEMGDVASIKIDSVEKPGDGDYSEESIIKAESELNAYKPFKPVFHSTKKFKK